MPLVGKNDRVTKKFADITISEGMKLGDLRKAVAGASSKNRARVRHRIFNSRPPLLLPPVLADSLKLTDLNRIELRQYVPEAEKKKMDRKQKKGVRFHCGAGNRIRGCEFPMRRVPARDFGALPERRDVGA
jgi:hypothetical protein